MPMTKPSFHIIGDSYVDYFCFLEQGLPEEGGDARLKVPLQKAAGGSATNTATHFASLQQHSQSHNNILSNRSNDNLNNPSSTNTAAEIFLHTVVNPNDEDGKLQLEHAKRHQLTLINCCKSCDIESSSDQKHQEQQQKMDAATGHCIVVVANEERTFMTHQGCMADFGPDHVDFDAIARIEKPVHIHIAGYYNMEKFWNGNLAEKLRNFYSQRENKTQLSCHSKNMDKTQYEDSNNNDKYKDDFGYNSTTISLVPQHDATGEWKGGLESLTPLLDFLFMNQLEANYITGFNREKGDDGYKEGNDADFSILLDHWISFLTSKCPQTCVTITKGAQGALCIRNGKVIHHQEAVFIETPVDPTGAGDAFIAGFTHGIWKWKNENETQTQFKSNHWSDHAIRHGLVYGVCVAACAVLQKGASVVSPYSEIQQHVLNFLSHSEEGST